MKKKKKRRIQMRMFPKSSRLIYLTFGLVVWWFNHKNLIIRLSYPFGVGNKTIILFLILFFWRRGELFRESIHKFRHITNISRLQTKNIHLISPLTSSKLLNSLLGDLHFFKEKITISLERGVNLFLFQRGGFGEGVNRA